MKSRKNHLLIWLLVVITSLVVIQCSSNVENDDKQLAVEFSGDAKIEVGSYYVGLEFHHSHPVPQRVSFYYPVANSLDESTDYWRRDTTFIMNIGMKFGEDSLEWFNKESWTYRLTPYSVEFMKSDNEKEISILYQFTKEKPAAVITYTIKNKSKSEKDVQLYTRNTLGLKTSHTYALKNKIKSEFIEEGKGILINNLSPETMNAELFFINPNRLPFDYQVVNLDDSSDSFGHLFPTVSLVDPPALNQIYRKRVLQNEQFVIKQIIGSCKNDEGNELVGYLNKNYESEITRFESGVLGKIYNQKTISTGDKVLDHSTAWAKGILEVNRHYIDGDIVPMPCPAEYNFFFTHDVLLTDLASVNFDLPRVKNDLEFIKKLSNEDMVIPHAYYWKDSSFVTEYATEDNWNNFWFVIVSAKYLMHSNDIKMLNDLYSYIQHALQRALKTKGEDNLMWSYMPDWWDIGRRYGQRSYMTILAIKALRSYLYISSVLEKNENELIQYESLADSMQAALNQKLWMDKYGYLMNYTDSNKIDEHYYCGSLLAAHYSLLDSARISTMLKTTKEKLLDPKLGIYTVTPMNFDELKDLWHFVGNEAGNKYYYLNGGIWPQSNAWYALALAADKRKADALKFIKTTMTLDGIINGPNGQPAMYEVRNGNYNKPKIYGTVDKPQFMWAAGWYLYSLYNVYGLKENNWNISFDPYLMQNQSECNFDLTNNNSNSIVNIAYAEKEEITKDGLKSYSFVLQQASAISNEIDITLGELEEPILISTNSLLEMCKYEPSNSTMEIKVKAFVGHKNKMTINSPSKPTRIVHNGNKLDDFIINKMEDGYQIKMMFTHENKTDNVILEFM